MESVIFEIKERGGLNFKSELGGGVRLLKGEDYFEVRKSLYDVQTKVRGRSSAFFEWIKLL